MQLFNNKTVLDDQSYKPKGLHINTNLVRHKFHCYSLFAFVLLLLVSS